MNSNNDLVSVVIPVFNSETFLEESIKSIINQTHKNQEIIAIDDGSTDNSLKILQLYADKITIHSQENQGLASAISVGIKMMKGKWFKWFSPDDTLFPNAIEVLLNEAKKLPENTIVYSNWELIDKNNKVLRSFSEYNYNNLSNFEFNVRLLDGQQINVNTSLIPTNLFKKGCLIRETKDPVAIDYDFFLRAALKYNTNFHLIPNVLVKYRIHKKQLSHENFSKSLACVEDIKKYVLSTLETKQQEKYLNSLKEYKKNKPISRKTMDSGLKFLTNSFPKWVTDPIILFYLNNCRRSR